MTWLTQKQETVLRAIKEFYVRHNQMPTLRELQTFLATTFGLSLKNVNSVAQYLNALESKGLIVRGARPRQISISEWKGSRFVRIPIIGWVSAGQATAFAQDNIDGYLKISQRLLGQSCEKCTAIRVRGDSMNQAFVNGKAIDEGSYVIVDGAGGDVRSGDIIVASIDGLLAVKEFRKIGKGAVGLFPRSSNPEHKPIYLSEDDIGEDGLFLSGKVIDVYHA